MSTITILLADDHEVVRRGVRALIEAEPGMTIVGETADGRQVVPALERLIPDVLVLDLQMPGLSGLEVLKAIAARRLETRVVVLSMHASEAYVSEALQSGALGYVVKDAGASDLLAAVRHAAAGERFLSAPLSESAIQAYARRVEAASKDPYETLSGREREVLQLAARGRTNQEIALQLTISRRTAETHRANLMRKLGLKGEKDLIRYAVRRGIVEL
jgi:DNA-binding NarL/FixJ family response regulator